MPRETPVTAVMTPEPVTVTPDVTVEEAVTLLARRRISGAPVVDSDGRLVGMLDDSDLIVSEARLHGPTAVEILGAYIRLPGEQRRFEEALRHQLASTVRDLMDPDPPWVDTNATVEDVATLIVDHGVSRVPVIDEGQVVGLVTRGDLVAAMGRSSG